MKKILEIGGFIAGAVLIVFGIAVDRAGVNGNSTVSSSLKQEKITGTPDMTPAVIKKEVAGQPWANDSASRPARSQASRSTAARSAHASRSTCGSTRSRRPAAYVRSDGPVCHRQRQPRRHERHRRRPCMKDGKPVANAARDIWVTETALTTALNVSYMATQLSLFSIVVGVALLLAGIGFVVLDWAALHRGAGGTDGVEPPHRGSRRRRPALV